MRADNIKNKKLRGVSSHMGGCRPWRSSQICINPAQAVLAYGGLGWRGNVEMAPPISSHFVNTQEDSLYCSGGGKSKLSSNVHI